MIKVRLLKQVILKMKMKQISVDLTASVKQTTKRAYSDKFCVTGESKKGKGEFVRQYNKKYLELGFTIACSEQSP